MRRRGDWDAARWDCWRQIGLSSGKGSVWNTSSTAPPQMAAVQGRDQIFLHQMPAARHIDHRGAFAAIARRNPRSSCCACPASAAARRPACRIGQESAFNSASPAKLLMPGRCLARPAPAGQLEIQASAAVRRWCRRCRPGPECRCAYRRRCGQHHLPPDARLRRVEEALMAMQISTCMATYSAISAPDCQRTSGMAGKIRIFQKSVHACAQRNRSLEAHQAFRKPGGGRISRRNSPCPRRSEIIRP